MTHRRWSRECWAPFSESGCGVRKTDETKSRRAMSATMSAAEEEEEKKRIGWINMSVFRQSNVLLLPGHHLSPRETAYEEIKAICQSLRRLTHCRFFLPISSRIILQKRSEMRLRIRHLPPETFLALSKCSTHNEGLRQLLDGTAGHKLNN